MSQNDCKKNYAVYAKNIDIKHLSVNFDGEPGRKEIVHGDKKSVKSHKGNVTFRSKTMVSSDGKFKVWVYRGPTEKWLQDAFEVESPTAEEVLRVMLERATGVDAEGNKVEIST